MSLRKKYDGFVDSGTDQDLATLVNIIDKKLMNANAFAAIGDIAYYPLLSHDDRFDKAISEGKIPPPKNPQNTGYLDTLREVYRPQALSRQDTGHVFAQLASFARAPGVASSTPIMEIVVNNPKKTNQFISSSSISSSPFRATLSVTSPAASSSSQAASQGTAPIILNRQVDFAALPDDAVVESVFYGRELLRLDASRLPSIETKSKAPLGSIKTTLGDAIAQVRSRLPNADLRTLDRRGRVLDITKCLERGTGVCRHHSLYMAWHIGQLVKQGQLPPGQVNHYRAATNTLKAHSLVVYTPKNTTPKTWYLIDSAQNICEHIQNQRDFEHCIAQYNDRGLHWILRNLAHDHGFTYPASENNRPIGLDAILRFVGKAKQTEVMPILERQGLLGEQGTDIRQTPENKERLWQLLIEHECILPEEEVLDDNALDAQQSVSAIAKLEPESSFPWYSAGRDSLIRLLEQYKVQRNQESSEYRHHFFWIGLGVSKTQKMDAVDALISHLKEKEPRSPITDAQLAALRNGVLGRTIRTFVKAGSANGFFQDTAITGVRELVNALNNHMPLTIAPPSSSSGFENSH